MAEEVSLSVDQLQEFALNPALLQQFLAAQAANPTTSSKPFSTPDRPSKQTGKETQDDADLPEINQTPSIDKASKTFSSPTSSARLSNLFHENCSQATEMDSQNKELVRKHQERLEKHKEQQLAILEEERREEERQLAAVQEEAEEEQSVKSKFEDIREIKNSHTEDEEEYDAEDEGSGIKRLEIKSSYAEEDIEDEFEIVSDEDLNGMDEGDSTIVLAGKHLTEPTSPQELDENYDLEDAERVKDSFLFMNGDGMTPDKNTLGEQQEDDRDNNAYESSEDDDEDLGTAVERTGPYAIEETQQTSFYSLANNTDDELHQQSRTGSNPPPDYEASDEEDDTYNDPSQLNQDYERLVYPEQLLNLADAAVAARELRGGTPDSLKSDESKTVSRENSVQRSYRAKPVAADFLDLYPPDVEDSELENQYNFVQSHPKPVKSAYQPPLEATPQPSRYTAEIEVQVPTRGLGITQSPSKQPQPSAEQHPRLSKSHRKRRHRDIDPEYRASSPEESDDEPLKKPRSVHRSPKKARHCSPPSTKHHQKATPSPAKLQQRRIAPQLISPPQKPERRIAPQFTSPPQKPAPQPVPKSTAQPAPQQKSQPPKPQPAPQPAPLPATQQAEDSSSEEEGPELEITEVRMAMEPLKSTPTARAPGFMPPKPTKSTTPPTPLQRRPPQPTTKAPPKPRGRKPTKAAPRQSPSPQKHTENEKPQSKKETADPSEWKKTELVHAFRRVYASVNMIALAKELGRDVEEVQEKFNELGRIFIRNGI